MNDTQHKQSRPRNRAATGDRFKVHLRLMTLNGKTWRIITLRPGVPTVYSTNFFHDTWHIISDADGAKLLARVLWAMSYQREPNTLFVLHGDNIKPTPFDAEPSLPVVICPANVTAPDPQAFRELKAVLKQLPPPTATVRLRTWGLDAVLEEDLSEGSPLGEPRGGYRAFESADVWQKETMTLRGGLICYCAPPPILRWQAQCIHDFHGGKYPDYHYLVEYAGHGWHHGDGEVQIFRNYREMLSIATEARHEVLQAGGEATREAVWNRAEIVKARRANARRIG